MCPVDQTPLEGGLAPLGGVRGEGAVGERSEDRAGNRRDPEQPELRDRPTTDEHRDSGAPGWIDRGVCNRNADEVDEGEPETDRDGREALGGALVGRSE